MPETSDFKLQVSIKLSDGPMLNVRANDVEELEELLNGCQDSDEPAITQFFGQRARAPRPERSDTRAPRQPTQAINLEEPAGATCPQCNNGTLQQRSGRYGAFIGCSAYPDCDYTEQV